VSCDAAGIHADISPETARVSALGGLRRGAVVNLERPLRADARLGGHFVQGHVDATGTIEDIRQDGDSYWVTIKYPAVLAPYLVRKGSIAVNGISLTAFNVKRKSFRVAIVPFTFEHTNIKELQEGDPVNLEFDMIGKYLLRRVSLKEK